jgi:hypothetical protein
MPSSLTSLLAGIDLPDVSGPQNLSVLMGVERGTGAAEVLREPRQISL